MLQVKIKPTANSISMKFQDIYEIPEMSSNELGHAQPLVHALSPYNWSSSFVSALFLHENVWKSIEFVRKKGYNCK